MENDNLDNDNRKPFLGLVVINSELFETLVGCEMVLYNQNSVIIP